MRQVCRQKCRPSVQLDQLKKPLSRFAKNKRTDSQSVKRKVHIALIRYKHSMWLWRQDSNLRPPGYELLSSCQTLALQSFCVHFWPKNREKPEGRIQCIHGVIFWYGSRCGSGKFARFGKCNLSVRMGHYGSTPLFTGFGEKRGYSIGVVIVNCRSQFVKELFQTPFNTPVLPHQMAGKCINNTKQTIIRVGAYDYDR